MAISYSPALSGLVDLLWIGWVYTLPQCSSSVSLSGNILRGCLIFAIHIVVVAVAIPRAYEKGYVLETFSLQTILTFWDLEPHAYGHVSS